jgi:hypothetical protein
VYKILSDPYPFEPSFDQGLYQFKSISAVVTGYVCGQATKVAGRYTPTDILVVPFAPEPTRDVDRPGEPTPGGVESRPEHQRNNGLPTARAMKLFVFKIIHMRSPFQKFSFFSRIYIISRKTGEVKSGDLRSQVASAE